MCAFTGFVVTLTNKLLISPEQLPGSSIMSVLHTTASGDVFRHCYIKPWTFWCSHSPNESAEPESLWYVPSSWMDLSFEIGMLWQCYISTYLGGSGEISVFSNRSKRTSFITLWFFCSLIEIGFKPKKLFCSCVWVINIMPAHGKVLCTFVCTSFFPLWI